MVISSSQPKNRAGNLARWSALLYGLTCYVLTMLSELYLVGFVAELGFLPKTINSGPKSPLSEAVLINALLITLYGALHSLMARPGFKAIWTRLVPQCVERSTYILVASLTLIVVMWQWRTLPQTVWVADNSVGALALYALCGLGWNAMFLSSFLIDHWSLFGVAQVLAYFHGTALVEAPFQAPLFYAYIRHPMQMGMLVGVWAIPVMTLGHFLFAAFFTVYALVGLHFEESGLLAVGGDFEKQYRLYQKNVGMLLPKSVTPYKVPAARQ